MFRLLDRYLLGQFLTALTVFILAFVGLYVVIDVFAHFEDFLRIKSIPIASFMFEFYVLRLPLILTRLLPMVTVFATMYAVLRLRRNNEFLPMVASGISLRRVLLPFFLMGGLTGGAVLALEEWVLPGIGDLLVGTQTTLDRGEKGYFILATDSSGVVFYMDRYDGTTDEMGNVMVTRFGDDGGQIEKIFARKGHWMGGARGGWRLENGKAYAYDADGALIPEGTHTIDSTRLHETDLKPGDILKSGSLDLYETFAELIRQARLHPFIPVFEVRIQTRLAFPLASIILMGLTIPIVMNQDSQSVFVGLGVCLGVCAAYFILHLILLDMGNRGTTSPAVAAWTPNVVFGVIGTLFMARMRT